MPERQPWDLIEEVEKDLRRFEISKYIDPDAIRDRCQREDLTGLLKDEEFIRSFFSERLLPYRTHKIFNYYDSDPFDYRDATFCHIDGKPADYGDVVRVLGSEERPLDIITAGWGLNDAVAQTAAKKLVDLFRVNTRLFNQVQISAHSYEKTAREDLDLYFKQIQDVAFRLRGLNPNIRFFTTDGVVEDMDFKKMIVTPFRKLVDDINGGLDGVKYSYDCVSRFSGRLVEDIRRDTDIDVMDCMPGIHIWPNGDIAIQQVADVKVQVEKGHRPQALGVNIFPE